jgi:D-alanyl-D-alanine carboxypeptidase/D-alanyl-D-alanine-endopeptidase (penicillin-binding protein 4)
VDYYTVQAQVHAEPAKSKDMGVQVERLPGSRTIRLYGTMAADAPVDVEELAIDDPAAYAAMAFRSILMAHGIAVTGTSRARHNPVRDGRGFTAQVLMPNSPEEQMANGSLSVNCMAHLDPAPMLATHTSAPLADDVVLTNKVSQNLHAEVLLHRLGRVYLCGSGSNVEGARMIRSYMARAGVQKNDFMLYDGSGLSDHDVVAPRALTKFLGYAATQPWFAQFKASLPDAGVDGTLAARFKPPLAYKVSAKTGTLGETRALSGYVTTAAGQTLVFSIMVDTHLPTTTADRVVMDKIVETIATVP